MVAFISASTSHHHLLQPRSKFRTVTRKPWLPQRSVRVRLVNAVSTDISNVQSPEKPRKNLVLSGLVKLAAEYWTGPERFRAWAWTVLTILFAVATSAYAVLLSFVQRIFWNALSAKDQVKFQQMLGFYAVAVIVGPAVLVLFSWAKGKLSLEWRSFLTTRFLSDYMTESRFFRLFSSDRSVDNPDQRIAEDIRQVTLQAVELMCSFAVGIGDIVIFSFILYKIYPPLYLFLLGYAALGTIITVGFGRGLITLNSAQLSKEADFRYSLVRVRENAESIAFYNGGDQERQNMWRLFFDSYNNQLRILRYQRNLGFFTTAYRYFVQLLPSLVIAPIYFAGNMPLGAISQTYFSFNHVLSGVSLVVNEFTNLSLISAGIRRLIAFDQALWDTVDVGSTASIVNKEDPSLAEGDYLLKVNGLSVRTPGRHGRSLVEDVHFEVTRGQRLLVVGDSGVGKSSLMRAISGLWVSGVGQVTRLSKKETLFLPQRPYLMLGSLRQNVLYPNADYSRTEQEIVQALDAVNLPDVVTRLGSLNAKVDQMSAILSLGEQQRLAFARILLSQPTFLILDESTSALDIENEKRMYDLIAQRKITCISVGNRPSLFDYHDSCLRLYSDGSWELTHL